MNPKLLDRVNDAIGGNDVLSKLRASSKQKLVAGATFQELDKDAMICHQNSPAVRFWLVACGEVKLLRYTSKGSTLAIDIVLPGQIFGAVFCERNPVYPSSAATTKRTELFSFARKNLMDELEYNSPVQRMLLSDTCRRLSQAQQMRALWLEEAPIRIAHLLLYLHAKFGRAIPQTRATLAELAGTSVETAIRLTNILARRGILATRRGQIEILSLPGLRACAER
jgi:CRP-like cAMP-binding protein